MAGGGSSEVKPTEDQRAQQQVNAELWNHYMKNYQPYIEKYTDKTLANAGAEEAAVANTTNAEVMKRIPRPSANPVADTINMGNAAEIGSNTIERSVGKARQRTIGSMENLVNIGRGQATQAVAGINDIAAQSVNRAAGLAEVDQQASTDLTNAVGSAVGAGTAIATRPKNRTLAYV